MRLQHKNHGLDSNRNARDTVGQENIEENKMASNNGFLSVQQFEEDMEFFAQCAQKAKSGGLLSLEKEIRDMEDGFHKTALTMVIDGHNPQLLEQVLRERAKTLSFIYQRRLEMAIAAVLSIQSGDPAKVTTMKCKAFFSESEK